MIASYPTPWQARISNAIIDFPVWGRLRPSSARGHAVTALAFHDWSHGGLGVAGCESNVKSIDLYMYACAFTAEQFEAVFVDWKEGWCNNPSHSANRFMEDAGAGKTVYSYSHGAFDAEQIKVQRLALTPQDQLLVLALKMHLDDALGVFDWVIWLNTAAALADKQPLRKGLSYVEPAKLEAGGYLLPIRDPYRSDQTWPTGLSGNELCSYLGARPRETGTIEFFAFQERLDRYLMDNSDCVWNTSHSARLLKLLGEGNRNTHAAHFFSVWEHDDTWPAPSTRVIGPRFSQYAQSLVGSMQYVEEDQLDTAWMAVSHFVPDATLFDMFDTVFQGKEHFDGSEELRLDNTVFRMTGTRGQRGCLKAMASVSIELESSILNALRQARAWSGGILSVDTALFQGAPDFWKMRFERREVAALLDPSGNAIYAHPHFYYQKVPLDIPHSMTMRNSHSFVEYSLFQENARMWRGKIDGTLECAWGWKKCLDQQVIKPGLPINFPGTILGKMLFKWREIRARWLHTMGPGDAAFVYGILNKSPSWPIETSEYKKLAEHYLRDDPMLFALCEMMEFDEAGVLTALRAVDCIPGISNTLSIAPQELGPLLEPFD